MSWEIWIAISLVFFIGGLILGFYLATRWVDPGDDIEIGKAKAKQGGKLDLTDIFKFKRKRHD